MKKLLIINFINILWLFFSSCSVWNTIGAGGIGSVKQYSIHGIKQKNLEALIVDLFNSKIIYDNINRVY